MLWVAISPLRIPLLVKAARTAAPTVETFASASLFVAASALIVALKRTVSGVTLTVPVTETVIPFADVSVAAVAGVRDSPARERLSNVMVGNLIFMALFSLIFFRDAFE
jgi:hypothetical protein